MKEMKLAVAISVGLLSVSLVSSAPAFSPIVDVDEWPAQQVQDIGFEFNHWADPNQDGPLHWFEIRYDVSKLPGSMALQITANIASDTGEFVGFYRSNELKGNGNIVQLLFSVRPSYIAQSSIVTLFYSSKASNPDVTYRVTSGYRLSLSRMLELVPDGDPNREWTWLEQISPTEIEQTPGGDVERLHAPQR